MAAVVVLALAGGRAVGPWAAHGGCGRAVAAGAALLGWVVGAGVLCWVGGGWHVGGFVGHGCGVWKWWLWVWFVLPRRFLCEGVGSGGRSEAEVEVSCMRRRSREDEGWEGVGTARCDGLCDDRDSFATDGYVK